MKKAISPFRQATESQSIKSITITSSVKYNKLVNFFMQYSFSSLNLNSIRCVSTKRRRSNKQNGPKAERVQEQKNRKILTFFSLYELIDKFFQNS